MNQAGVSLPSVAGHRIAVLANQRTALSVTALLMVVWVMKHQLQAKYDLLESRVERAEQEQIRLVQEEALLTRHNSDFNAKISENHRSAATRLAWEVNIQQMVRQQNAELERLIFDAQRVLFRQPLEQGYHLTETAIELELNTVSETSAYKLVSGLTGLGAFASTIDGCEMAKRETSLQPVSLSCELSLYEIKRN